MKAPVIDDKDLVLLECLDCLKPGQRSADLAWQYLEEGSPLIAHKALERLKTLDDIGHFERLKAYIVGEDLAEEIRLRALGVLFHWMEKDRDQAMAAAYELLDEFLKYDNPYFAKAIVGGLGYIGSIRGLKILLDYAKSPAGRMVRPEIVEEALMLAYHQLPDLAAWLEAQKDRDHLLKIYFKDFELKPLKYRRFSLYPSNDYMALKVRAMGMDYASFKKLLGKE